MYAFLENKQLQQNRTAIAVANATTQTPKCSMPKTVAHYTSKAMKL